MDSVYEMLADLSRRGAHLWVEADELRCRAPKNALTAHLRAAIQERKEEILAVLRERARVLPTAIPKIQPAPGELHLPFPLSDMQQALWVGQRDAFEVGNVSSNAYVELEAVTLDWDRFTRAWSRVIQRHGMLRGIVLSDGQNQILPQVPEYKIELLDLRGQSADAVATRLEDIRRTMPQETLMPEEWPLFRLRATRLDGDRTRLHIITSLLIADSLSLQLLGRDLALLYSGQELPPLELSYRDYIVAKTALRGSPIHERALDYWRRRLPTLPPPPELPVVNVSRSAGHLPFVALAARLLEPAPWERMKARANEAGLMAGTVLLTAFSDVVATWSKTADFSINSPFFDRLPIHGEVNEIVGSFTLPNHLAVQASPGATFLERARRVQQQLVDDLEHCRYVSGVQVMRELAKARGGTPRKNKYVVFNSVELHSLDISALGTVVYAVSQTPQVYLEVRSGESNGALVCTWDVVEPLFPPGLVQDMLDAFGRHVRRLAEEPGSWEERGRRHIMPERQRTQHETVNATAAPLPAGLLHSAFVAQVAQRAERPAVVSTARTLTYRDLDRHSTRLGRWLRDQGAAPNTLVGVVMEKGWEQVVAVLGVLKSGAAYLPLDPVLPQARLHHILEDAEVGIVLTQGAVDERLTWPEGVRCLRVDTQALEDVAEWPLDPVQGEGDLAYVIYTSGSTGRPKGVMISHRAAVNTIVDVNQRFQIGSDDRVLGVSSLSFDLSVYDVFGTLAAGGTLVLPDESGLRDPAHWLEMIERGRVTVWNSVPALMEMLIEYAEGLGTAVPASLRLALLSGDWIPLALPDRLRRLVPGVRVISLGGATEASIWSILHPIDVVDPGWASIPYGKPMANQQIHVLDEGLDTRPVWVPGDLYIGGVGLADGYWHDEDRTSAAFVTHPETGERLYRTGDRGRRLPDGNIELLGREDFQVKIGGYRIELGEIEGVLREHRAVRAAVVLAAADDGQSRRLVAYVVAAGDPPPKTGELRAFLRDKLPEYMIPKTVILLDALPLTANGKIDRSALAAYDLPSAADGRAAAPPRTPLEEKLAQLWSQALGVTNVGIDDNFFDLSRDSLQAVRLVSKMSAAVGRHLTVRFLFAHPTIAELSAALEAPMTNGKGANGQARNGRSHTEELGDGIVLERRDLLTLFAAGKLAPVDAAALLALPSALFDRVGLDQAGSEAAIDAVLGGLPLLGEIMTTPLGRIAVIMIPRLNTAELYADVQDLVGAIVEGLELAGRLGASTASLTGLLASATDYGRAVLAAVDGRTDLPRVTTGHDTTAASVVLGVRNILRQGGRELAGESLGCLGLGSVGKASLRLLLARVPHPRELLLCDLYGKVGMLEQFAHELRTTLGYRGEIRVMGATSTLPDEFYEATLIVGATNAPDVLDVDRLRPGTLVVDDSVPPCYRREVALARVQERYDLLFAEGGVLHAGEPIGKLIHVPGAVPQLMGPEGVEEFLRNSPDASSPSGITSCILSSLLTARVDGLAPSVGPADPGRCAQHVDALLQLGFEAGPLQCDGELLSAEAISRFREQFGARPGHAVELPA
jgi:pyochelin synthetase